MIEPLFAIHVLSIFCPVSCRCTFGLAEVKHAFDRDLQCFYRAFGFHMAWRLLVEDPMRASFIHVPIPFSQPYSR